MQLLHPASGQGRLRLARILQAVVFVLLALVLVVSTAFLAVYAVALVLFNDTGRNLTAADFLWPLSGGPLRILPWPSAVLAGSWVGLRMWRRRVE